MIFVKNIKFCCLHLYRKLHSDVRVRVRFAPSPTGFLHLGGLRTAFYNYLFAKKNKGSFILRIEDTDQKRIKPGSVENLLSVLKWTGLFPDESPEVGGPYAPYTQSERLKIYKEKADILLQSGAAYRCFCSELRLNLLKKEAHIKNLNRGYDNKCRSLTPSEEKELLSKNTPFTLRFKIPEGQVIHRDMVYGESAYNLSDIEGDFVILKSDGFPTYHFSCVVDDHLMKISHVLRGTEWLISTPKHILLHQSFGWTPPKYAHLPLLINSDRTKLSKRQDSIGVEHFKNKGYYPESLLNFLAAAGGGFGRQEGCFVYDLNVLSSKFQLENVNTNPCILDIRKLDLFNHNYIVKQLSNEETALSLVRQLRSILKEKYGQRYDVEKKNLPDSYLLRILKMHKDRVNNLYNFVEKDMEYLWASSDFKMVEELKVSQSILHGWKKVLVLLSTLSESEYSQEVLAVGLKDICAKNNIPYVPFMKSLRIVFAGQKVGPSVSEILVMLGKNRCTNKIRKVLEKMDKSKMSGCM